MRPVPVLTPYTPHRRATLGAGSSPIMPNASAYNPDPTQGQAKSVRNARVGGGKSIRRTSDDAKYVPHTRIPSKHPTERCPTRDDRYRQDLHARAGGGQKRTKQSTIQQTA